MIKLRFKLSLLVTLLTCLLIPSFASAQSTYGCGTYGSGSYGSNCQSTTTSSSSTTTDTNSTAVIEANGTALTTDTTNVPEFSENQPIEFSGKTFPYAEVHLYFQSEPFEAVTNADAEGNWSYTLTRDLGPGQHTVRIAIKKQEETSVGTQSEAFAFAITPTSSSTSGSTDTSKKTASTDYTWWYVGGGIVLLAVAVAVWLLLKRRNQASNQTPKSPYF